MLFHLLEQVVYLDICIAVMGIVNFGTLPEKGICFVKEKDCIAYLSFPEDLFQVLLGFPDVLAHDAGNINFVEVEPHLPCDNLGSQGLACARRACKKDIQPFPE